MKQKSKIVKGPQGEPGLKGDPAKDAVLGSNVLLDTRVVMKADIDMNTNLIKKIGYPVDLDDVATKRFVNNTRTLLRADLVRTSSNAFF